MAFHLALFNACTNSKSGEEPSSSSAGNTEGNGKTYDGKIRIVHRYDEKDKIYCKEVEIPRDVLYRETESDQSWYLLVNKQNCKQDPAVHVDQVSYDDNLKVATYKGQNFYPPKSLNVNPKENPDLPDINVNDGLCIDENGLCSLRAATEQASYISATTEVVIKLLAGTYPILKPLELHFPKAQNGHQVYFEGEGRDKTIIDGQLKTSHLIIDGSSGGLTVSNLSFIKGNRLTAFSSSSILPYYFNGALNIENCMLNQTAPVQF